MAGHKLTRITCDMAYEFRPDDCPPDMWEGATRKCPSMSPLRKGGLISTRARARIFGWARENAQVRYHDGESGIYRVYFDVCPLCRVLMGADPDSILGPMRSALQEKVLSSLKTAARERGITHGIPIYARPVLRMIWEPEGKGVEWPAEM